MNILERGVRRVDAYQQARPVLAFPVAVVQKFGNDRAAAFATRIAYKGLFSLFPLLLLLTTMLGFTLSDHPQTRQRILDSALAQFPIIGRQLRDAAHPLRGSGLALAIGIGGTIYGALGVGQAIESALNTVWNIPYVDWPNAVFRRVRSAAMVAVLGVATLVSAGLSMAAGAVAIGWVGEVLGYGGASLVTFAVFLTVFMVLTAEPVAWRDAVFGAGVATVFWQALQGVGTWFVARQLRGAGDTYGFFAVVIALLSWMYMAAQLVLFAAEINVVRKYRLWPRSMTQPPLTPSDRETFERLARLETRRPEYEVSVRFKPSADGDPLAHDAGPRSPQLGDGAPWRRARRSHRNP